MKTIITSTSNSLDGKFDLRFGRAKYLCVYDDEKKAISFEPNEYADAASGAGSKVAEQVVSLGVTKVISGDFGPKAKTVLQEFQIQMVILEEESYTIQEVINKIK